MENCGGPQERCCVLPSILTGIIVLIEGHSGTSCTEIKRMLSLCAGSGAQGREHNSDGIWFHSVMRISQAFSWSRDCGK